jgi:choline dehydrogenase-like flavoprotein
MKPEEFTSIDHDYIIIGGGAAGLLLAGRLSEDTTITVGVLEAGIDNSNNPIVTIPGLAMQPFEQPDLDWDFKTVPQVRNVLLLDVRVAGFMADSDLVDLC